MKSSFFKLAALAVLVCVLFTGCGSSKQTGQVKSDNKMKFVEPPCTLYDDDMVFTGTSTAYGSLAQEAVVRRAALTNAQNIARQKVKHAYQGMVSDYFNLVGNNNGNTARSNIEGAGDQIIDIIVNDTQEKCIRRSEEPDEKGNITYYIGIVINKKEAVDKIANALSKNDELDVRFKESNFRERMDEKFKNYKESQNK